MDDFRIDEVLMIKPVSEDSFHKKEFTHKKKKQIKKNEEAQKEVEVKDEKQPHIDIYV